MYWVPTVLFLLVSSSLSAADIPIPDKEHYLSLPNQLRIIGFLSLVSMIPVGIMMMTSFTRLSIIFQFLKQAIGAPQVPSNEIIIALSIILTGYIMHPVIEKINQNAIIPYRSGQILELPEVKAGLISEEAVLLERSWAPLRAFLLKHTREKDIQLFLDIGHIQLKKRFEENNTDSLEGPYDLNSIPWYCIIPSFIMSELRTAFMMGFLLFLPFLIIDMVVASVLMSMGMMMLPPIMVSTPFKLLLFILIDGWRLVIQQMVIGFQTTV